MMDLKEIIKWFIPCFYMFPLKKRKMDRLLTFVCLFWFFNSSAGKATKVNSDVDVSENIVDSTKNVGFILNDYDDNTRLNASESRIGGDFKSTELKSADDSTIGRTFGRPFMKKVIGGLIPLVFQIGAASTWAVVAAIVGVKTLLVTLLILKLLVIAGAAKIGALFASKGHHQGHGWEPPPAHQKEIHLHIHNGQLGHHEEHVPVSSWSREGYTSPDTKNVNIVFDPYSGGPQTISTPYGNYVKIDPSTTNT